MCLPKIYLIFGPGLSLDLKLTQPNLLFRTYLLRFPLNSSFFLSFFKNIFICIQTYFVHILREKREMYFLSPDIILPPVFTPGSPGPGPGLMFGGILGNMCVCWLPIQILPSQNAVLSGFKVIKNNRVDSSEPDFLKVMFLRRQNIWPKNTCA